MAIDRDRTVQVVLGEAERTGILRFVLEGEGFDIVGMASNDEELERVLVGARPSVIVLDGGISAAAALEARERADGASLVVVWPEGVASVLAEERVDPHLVMEDLGEAVRRASHRAADRDATIRVPDVLEIASPVAKRHVARARPQDDEAPKPERPGRGRGRVLVAVATWILVLTALATIAAAVPNALDVFAGNREPRRSPSPAQVRRPDERVVDTGSARDVEITRANCSTAQGSGQGADRSRGRDALTVRSKGCPTDRGNDAGGRRRQGTGGKPDDPGSPANNGGATQDNANKENPGRGGDAPSEKPNANPG